MQDRREGSGLWGNTSRYLSGSAKVISTRLSRVVICPIVDVSGAFSMGRYVNIDGG